MKKNLLLIGQAACLLLSCTQFLSVYQDIESNKIRPLAIRFEPAEAAPGDTVIVRYYGFAPDTNDIMRWMISLDYNPGLEGGTAVDRDSIDLSTLMLPGATDTQFSFIMPDSTLLCSSELAGFQPLVASVNNGKTVAQTDSMLKWDIANDSTPPQPLLGFIDLFRSTAKIKVHISGPTSGDVFSYMTVRYSRHFGSPNVIHDPSMNWIKMVKVHKNGLTNTDSITRYPDSVQYLYCLQYPDSVRDTVIIDTGYSYFVVADSGTIGVDTSRQIYAYISKIAPFPLITDTEQYDFQWFYTNLDNRNGAMVEDSLIMFGSSARQNLVSFLPPVDTAMHRFKLWVVVRDTRQDGEWCGVTEKDMPGYLEYTDGYAQSHPRKSGGSASGRF